MKLFLTSSTITKNLVDPFEKLIGKDIHGLKVLFIPDAAFGVENIKDISWVDEERQELVDNYDWEITDLVLRDKETVTAEMLENYDVIYVNGGFSGYLAEEMKRTGFDKALKTVLEKGVVYVGSSAGSMVMSDVQDASSWYISEPEPEALDIPGLGYINFQIYPHVDDEKIQKIKQLRNPKLTYYLLRDGQAVSIDGEKITKGGDIEVLEAIKN